MLLSTLPVDILLEIIQYLPFKAITSLSALSRSWAALIKTNESPIYRSTSERYGFAPKGGFDDAPPPEGWKAWFIRKLQVELRWMGKLPGNPSRVLIPQKAGNFHRIKVDEEAGYIINTFTNGGLVVSDIHDHRILWSLDEGHCQPYVHCEYDEGYIVFNRITDYKEVWRRSVDVLDIPEEAWPSAPYNRPDSSMIRANKVARQCHFDASRSKDPDHLRGHFVPWACLLVPEDGRAFKLTRGTLLVCSTQKAFLYNVENAELKQTIEILSAGRLRYVDISEQHIFVVNTLQLNVYRRSDGLNVLRIDAGRQPWGFYATPANQLRRALEFNYGELGFQWAKPPNWADREDYFHAAHVSSCGKHLAIMATSNRIILVQDFWRLFPTVSSSSPPTLTPSPITLQDISKQVDLYIDRPMLDMEGYLAYDRGKVATVGAHGVFVLVLDSILDQLGEVNLPPKDTSLQSLPSRPSRHEPSWPHLRLREVRFDHPDMDNTQVVSCLQLTETKLYLSVFSDDMWDERGDNMWCYDLASSPSFTSPIELPAEYDWDEEDRWDTESDWDGNGVWDDLEERLTR